MTLISLEICALQLAKLWRVSDSLNSERKGILNQDDDNHCHIDSDDKRLPSPFYTSFAKSKLQTFSESEEIVPKV